MKLTLLVALLTLVSSTEPFGMFPEGDTSLKFVDASGASELLRWLVFRVCFSDPKNLPEYVQSPAKLADFFTSFSEEDPEQLLSATWGVLNMKQERSNFRVCNINSDIVKLFKEEEYEPECGALCIQHVKINGDQEKQLRNLYNC